MGREESADAREGAKRGGGAGGGRESLERWGVKATCCGENQQNKMERCQRGPWHVHACVLCACARACFVLVHARVHVRMRTRPCPPHLFSLCGMGPPGEAPPLLWLRLEKPPAPDTACRAMPHPRFEQSDALAASGSRTNDQVLQGAVYSL